jgi:putative N6-adenine-specific DNA methylase
LYKRGAKQAVGKAPMRETLAAMFLAQCGFTGGEPVVDPMCGSGTFVIEAAEIAAGLAPGRARRFAFESLATFDAADWERLKVLSSARTSVPSLTFFGSDRDAGAVRMARENAKRAGVASFTRFEVQDIEEAAPPAGPAGLVVLNPPYGGRIGETRHLVPLYRAIGRVLGTGFAGWRVGLVTSEPRLAEATGLAFAPPPDAVLNGGLRLRLYVTGPLGARARD